MPPLPTTPQPSSPSSSKQQQQKSQHEPSPVYESAPVAVSWNTRDVLLFANSICCSADQLHYLYEEHPSFTAFPTYPIVLTFKHTHTSTIPFATHFDTHINIPLPSIPRLDSTRVVDGGRTLLIHRAIPSTSEGRNFSMTTKVLSVSDKGKGKPVIVVLEHSLNEATKEEEEEEEEEEEKKKKEKMVPYATVTETAIYLAQGGFNGPTTPPRLPPIPAVPPPSRNAPDVQLRHKISQTAHLLYRLNGDYNPLHADPQAGVNAGFKGEIMHGLYTWNNVARGIVEEFAGLPGTDGEGVLRCFEARFVSPTRPGDELRTECWVTGERDGWMEVLFRTWVKTEGEQEKVCLNGGRAVVRGRRGTKSRI